MTPSLSWLGRGRADLLRTCLAVSPASLPATFSLVGHSADTTGQLNRPGGET